MIHVIASERHFLDHLLPVWQALPEDLRGPLHTTDPTVAERGKAVGMEICAGLPRSGHAMAASLMDLRRSRSLDCALFEHGAGMTWGRAGGNSYAGASGRLAQLVVCPNPRSAALQRRVSRASVIDIGSSPRLDRWVGTDTSGRSEVAVSFHWDCRVVPELRSALWAYRSALEPLKDQFDLIGHAHPRIWGEAAAIYEAAGVEPVREFTEVMRRARLYAVDVSSTAYEFATLDLPVVSLNLPTYRRDVHHGLRFWELIPGPQCDSPDDLPAVISEALLETPEGVWQRRRAVTAVYPRNDGCASQRGAQALQEWLEGKHPVQSTPAKQTTWRIRDDNGRLRTYRSKSEAARALRALGGEMVD